MGSGENATRTEVEARRRRVTAVIGSYDDRLVRTYCHARFRIINRRFLDEIGQYLPSRGKVLELGCGFGLFGLYFASSHPGLSITGIDTNGGRIRMARRAAERLGVRNTVFHIGDARALALAESFDAVYMLDLIHHVPRPVVREMLTHVREHLLPGGVLLIKDVDTRPMLQMAFTWLLDVLMTRGELPNYWSSPRMVEELRLLGFQVFCHSMWDVLPYPHRLYFCPKENLSHLNGA
jgi:2-polyprenyl-3-methyl-5-hydroxy-6-metoxy-1,4-benzoquinol methylase